MGGAPFQIAIETPESVKSNSIHRVSVGQKSINLFAHSYLGYGVDEGLRKVSRSISAVLDQSQIQNPCVQNGYHTKIESIDVEGTGNFSSCSRLINAMLLKSVEFNSISVPNLEYIDRFVAMSSIYYTNKFFNLSRSSTLKELKTQALDFCRKDWSLLPDHITNISYSPTYCWKGTYQYNVLSKGYKFKDSNVVIDKENKINGVDLSWTVGSMLSEITEIEIDDQEKLTFKDFFIAALSVAICCILLYIAGFKRFNWLYIRKTRKML
ncbi:hypothetical protein TVAG_095420 [Trichomonas vaginalis G3]|uniref:Uncharacterized protein n=1 Tax=Trichomonas vaginalis (strain ATCC PRA-98 / G3) TaxID=412133 RepID=A2G6D5_TRIV3|nr:8-oxo-dGTP phosphohydrolase protein [Trichomonas vaginalis G3]EAX87283.1 hypothetical protein TVAG_095420 [Trichomonas vaginalis G3]KAI5529106.1 8-oxo-dGTP phosphohydrolase protein [Trichomonas vaginalis G3]|eukprot:XP_001300213.1 hypothetical protein [Trichomonas vaginalis G3]